LDPRVYGVDRRGKGVDRREGMPTAIVRRRRGGSAGVAGLAASLPTPGMLAARVTAICGAEPRAVLCDAGTAWMPAPGVIRRAAGVIGGPSHVGHPTADLIGEMAGAGLVRLDRNRVVGRASHNRGGLVRCARTASVGGHWRQRQCRRSDRSDRCQDEFNRRFHFAAPPGITRAGPVSDLPRGSPPNALGTGPLATVQYLWINPLHRRLFQHIAAISQRQDAVA
jgi:hypothetical protein